MITKAWKIIRGKKEVYTVNSSITTPIMMPVAGIKNISGEDVTQITWAYQFGGAYYTVGNAVGANNMRLFVRPSLDVNPETVVIATTNLNGTIDGINYSPLVGGCYKMVFGNGTSTATIEDYKLESPVTSGIILNNLDVVSHSYNSETNNYEAFVTANGFVTQDLTISEVGIVKSVCINETNSYALVFDVGNYTNILAVREALETPLELKAGDGFTITIKVEM